jgi:poly(beta-D-mannuronate) lyase
MNRFLHALLLTVVWSSAGFAREWRVTSGAEFAAALAQPGDVIVWPAGRYSDVTMRWKAQGTEAEPITLRAEVPGAVVFTGQSQLEARGAWLIIEGLTFEETTIDPIVLRDAQHCRVTACAIRACNPEGKRLHYLRIGGKSSADNRVDHCTFADKRTDGVMLVIDGDEGQLALRTRIDHNLFRGVYKSVRNGMEALRIGDSGFQRTDAHTVVEDNGFEECRGDAEVISVKSSANTIRGNVFTGCDGAAIVLRHGDRTVVEGNRIDGEERKKSGGIRVHGVGHIVRGNTIERTGAFAIALPAGNSVPKDSGHAPVIDALIEGNRVRNPAGLVFVLGEPHDDEKKQDTAPTRVIFRRNEVEGAGSQDKVKEFLKVEGGVKWE